MGWDRSFRFQEGKVFVRSGDLGTVTLILTDSGVHFIGVFKDVVRLGYLVPGGEGDDLVYDEFAYSPPIQNPLRVKHLYARSKQLREELYGIDSFKDFDELMVKLEDESKRREECVKEMRLRLPRGAPVDEECVIERCLMMVSWREAFQECSREG